METELGWLIELAVQHLESPVFADLCFPERGTAETRSWCSFWFLLTRSEAEAWLSLLGSVTTVANPILPNWTAGGSMRCLQVDRAATAS